MHSIGMLFAICGLLVGVVAAWYLWKLRKEDGLFIVVACGFGAIMLAFLGLAVLSYGG